MPYSLSLVWGLSVYFANFTIFITLLLSKLYTRYHNHTSCYFFLAKCQKLQNHCTLKFFLTQDHMQLEFAKCCFSHNFHWSPSKLKNNIGYHGKSKCLLEYCNPKLAFQNILGYWVFSSSRASRPPVPLVHTFWLDTIWLHGLRRPAAIACWVYQKIAKSCRRATYSV